MSDEKKKKVEDEELEDVSGGVSYERRSRTGNLTGFVADDSGPSAPTLGDDD